MQVPPVHCARSFLRHHDEGKLPSILTSLRHCVKTLSNEAAGALYGLVGADLVLKSYAVIDYKCLQHR